MEDSKPHISTISETWLHEDIPDSLITFPGYKMYRCDRQSTTKTQGGGLCTLVQSDLFCDSLKLSHLNISNDDIEVQWLIVKPEHMKTMVIGNVYRAPSANREAFLDQLSERLDEIDLLPDWEVHIMGDFNLNALIDSTATTRLNIIMSQAGLSQQITQPTRVTPSTATLIDHYFTNCKLIASAGSIPLNISDHDLIFLAKKKKPAVKVKANFRGRIYKNYDAIQFAEDLATSNLNAILEADDSVTAWALLLELIDYTLSLTCPIKTIRTFKPRNDWITVEIVEQVRLEDDLMVKARQSKIEAEWYEVKQAKNATKLLIKEAKASYLQKALANNRKNSKA